MTSRTPFLERVLSYSEINLKSTVLQVWDLRWTSGILVKRSGECHSPVGAPRMDKRTILLAEDNEMVRSFVCSVLECQGYRVLAAENGAEALALAKRVGLSGIALILADVDCRYLAALSSLGA